MSIINNNPNLIPNKKIIVPKIDRDIFVDGIIEVLKEIQEEEDYNYTFTEMKDALIFDDNKIKISEELTAFLTDDVIVSCEEAFVVNANFKNVANVNHNSLYLSPILGINQTNNGVVFWGVFMGGDWEKEAIKIIYFDGNDFKSYTPRYGNCINWNTKTAFGNDKDEDNKYLSQYNLDINTLKHLSISDTIDVDMIMQELDTVFQLQGNFTGSINKGLNNVSSPNNNSQPRQMISDVILKIFEERRYDLIPPLQQSILQQGFTMYDKSLCFKNIKDKDIMFKDICNYILFFNNKRDNVYKTIECQKLVTYIKKYKYYHEGYIY